MFSKYKNIFTWQNEIQKHLFGEASSLLVPAIKKQIIVTHMHQV